MSENQQLEESLKEKDKQINRLQMQIKLSSNLSKELERQKSLALEAQEEIKKSIQYASRIQTAMLPTDLPNAIEIAVLWKPLNVVGGDFYIIRDLGEQILIAVIDCTGHGVPGALLSTLTNSIFDRIIHDENVKMAGDYLIAAHNIISTLLGQHADKKVKSHDGFDGSVCLLHKENKKLSFAGARSSIILISNDGEKIELNGNRKSVGGSRTPLDYPFETHEQSLEDRILVMYTDGITDVMSEAPSSLLFGKEKFFDALSLWHGDNPQKIIKNIEIALENHRNIEPYRDDMTLLVSKFN